MVSHDIKEVAYIADRIVILGSHPGGVRTVVKNDLPRPRDYRSPGVTVCGDGNIVSHNEIHDVPRDGIFINSTS